MPRFDIVHAGLTQADNKLVTIKPQSVDATPTKGEGVRYYGILYRIVDVVHNFDRNVTELIVFEDKRANLGETWRDKVSTR